MKVYNKKGLVTGSIFCVMGVYILIKSLVAPSDGMISEIKHFVIAFLMLLIGLNCVIRAFSKKCTEEDRSSKKSVRNRIVKSKSQSLSFVILQAFIFIGILLSIIAFYFTDHLLAVTVLIVLGILLSISWIIELATTIYYETKQQGGEF